ncbi:MAG: F0F1 ATP synthase subunit delta [Patescibacteria group bacterium]|jgi:hypothetical protein
MKHSLNSVFKTLTTTKDADLFCLGLEKVISRQYTRYTSLEKALNDSLPYDQAEAVLDYCRQSEIDTEDVKTAEAELSSLQAKIRRLPVVSLGVAFEPRADFLAEVSESITRYFGKKVLLEMEVKPELIGGAVIEFAGRRRDFSLKTWFLDFSKQVNDKTYAFSGSTP